METDPWEGTCGFHNIERRDFWPLDKVAFRTNEDELLASARDLHRIADESDDEARAEVLLATAHWYEDFALDLYEIRQLPEVAA